MWRISVRDLQWRSRRFAIAILATGLVFALTLLMAGAGGGLAAETRRIVAVFGADTWLTAADGSGPFTTATVIAADTAAAVAALPGVTRAEPIAILHSTLSAPAEQDVNVIGRPIGGMGDITIAEGRDIEAPGEALVDTGLGIGIGERIEVSGRPLGVVGIATGITYWFGNDTVFIPLVDAQETPFSGQPLAMAIAVTGDLGEPPAGLQAYTNTRARLDLERPGKSATDSIVFISALLWIVAAGIIGSIIYLNALERTRELAVLKAMGSGNGGLLAGLAIQAVVLAVGSAAIGALLATAITPFFPFVVEITLRTHLVLAITAVVIGLLASLGGLRRAVTVDPAIAFGGA